MTCTSEISVQAWKAVIVLDYKYVFKANNIKNQKKLKKQAREESKGTKQGILLRLINKGNKEIADHIRKIDEKLNERSAK